MYINAGDVLTHLARHDEALENYRRALDIFPISPANRGKVGHQQQQHPAQAAGERVTTGP